MNRYQKHIAKAVGFLIGLHLTGLSACMQQSTVATDSGATGTSASQAVDPAREADPVLAENQQALAFPGAEGFGKYTTGGRGGKVVVVTNLNDSGPGSLREALRMKEARIVVFAVAGTIALESSLDINHGNLTIAGQSAPGDGIALRNFPMKIKGDNVIVRYLRFRMGDKKAFQGDALGANGQKNIIIDHVSMSWGTDESASFYNNENFTLQWSIISESLNESVHEKGAHGYGGIWGGRGASFHHNLLVHLKSRTPRFSGSKTTANSAGELVDFRNNLIYNWKDNNVYGGEKGQYNLVGNYYKPGPATSKSKKARILEPYAPYGQFYLAGNVLEGFPEVSQENRKGVAMDHPDSALTASPFPAAAIVLQPAKEAYERVLAQAGASLQRDKIDQRLIQEAQTGTATYGKDQKGIIDSQDEVGGWPVLDAGTVLEDKDADGMPTAWELQHKLDPENAADAAGYTLSKVYTNIEVYLNSLVDTEKI